MSLCFVKKYPIDVSMIPLSTEESQKDQKQTFLSVMEADFIVFQEKIDTADLNDYVKWRIIETRSFIEKNLELFFLIDTFELPGGNKLHLYRRKGDYVNLQKHRASLYFRDGVVKLYYKGLPLTKDSGVGASFGLSNTQHYSQLAKWKIEYADRDKIIATASWPDASINQKWQFDLLNGNEINLTIKPFSVKDLEIEDFSVWFIFNPAYKELLAEGRKIKLEPKNVFVPTSVCLSELTRPMILHSYGVEPNLSLMPTSYNFKIKPIILDNKILKIIRFDTEKNKFKKSTIADETSILLSVRISLKENNK